MATNDSDLLMDVASGDQEAFAQIYRLYSSRLFALLIKIMGQPAEAEDVLQETFLQVWRSAGQYDVKRSSPMTWLVMIARSRALDQLRRRKPVETSSDTGPQQGDTTSEVIEKAETDVMVRGVLSQLPEEQRHAITLAFYCGMTHEQIAQKHSLPLGTVKTRIRRGMQKLRHSLSEQKGASV